MRTMFLLAAGLLALMPAGAQSLADSAEVSDSVVVSEAADVSVPAAPYKVHGGAWVESGRIMHSSEGSIDLDGSWLQSTGAQFTVVADLGDHWDGAFGFGAYQVNHSMASSSGLNNQPRFLAITMFKSYLTEARVTYARGKSSAPWFSATFGNFVHNYNPDAKNLGMYLLRGPVYPGVLFSGYDEHGTDTTRANVLGARLHTTQGHFSHDLILQNEKDLPPTFDWSLAYITKYRPVKNFEIGAGVNFYRVMAYNPDLETPGRLPGADPSLYDTTGTGAGGDTLFYTHQGIKLVGMFSLDLKPLIGTASMGPQDLKLYGEAAILGVKDYGSYYDDITERIPVMVGFNLPMFGLLDLLSLEVEWYRSPYKNDLANIGNPGGIVADWTRQDRPTPSPAPISSAQPDRDNWKWSVNLEKTVRKHIQFSAQVANDHFRPRPIATGLITSSGGTAAAFTTPKDWYFTFRAGYAF